MTLSLDWDRIKSTLLNTETNTLLTEVSEVGTAIWVDIVQNELTKTIARIVYTPTLEVANANSATQMESLQLGGIEVYTFPGDAASYVSGSAPALTAGTKVAEIPVSPQLLVDLNAFFTAAGDTPSV